MAIPESLGGPGRPLSCGSRCESSSSELPPVEPRSNHGLLVVAHRMGGRTSNLGRGSLQIEPTPEARCSRKGWGCLGARFVVSMGCVVPSPVGAEATGYGRESGDAAPEERIRGVVDESGNEAARGARVSPENPGRSVARRDLARRHVARWPGEAVTYPGASSHVPRPKWVRPTNLNGSGKEHLWTRAQGRESNG
jgi:hypothetical protein